MTRHSHARQTLKVCRQCAAELRAAAEASPDPATWRVLRSLALMIEQRAAGLAEGRCRSQGRR